jgi:lipoprotein signal peptidase
VADAAIVCGVATLMLETVLPGRINDRSRALPPLPD